MASLTITKKMIPETNANFPGSLLNDGLLEITVHETGNTSPGADADNEARFVYNGGGKYRVAFHFAVDWKADNTHQMLPLNRIGWHAGDGCDDRQQDIGCFGSVAIEVCVGDNNAHAAETRANLIELLAMIIEGDSQIDFGGTDHKRFSADRISPHKRWSSYSKDCPRFMLADGYFWTVPSKVAGRLVGGGGAAPPAIKPVPVPELVKYRSGNPDNIPAIVRLADGTKATFVGDRVKAIRRTPRLQLAFDGAPKLSKDILVGEEFDVDWVFENDDAEDYYLSPFWTRIKVADTTRVADRRSV